MTDDHTIPRHQPFLPEDLDLDDRAVLDAVMVSAGGHDHIDSLSARVNHLLRAFTALHLMAAGMDIDCHKLPQHDELSAEIDRVDDLTTRARAGIWN